MNCYYCDTKLIRKGDSRLDNDDEYSWNDDGADSELEYEKYEYSDED